MNLRRTAWKIKAKPSISFIKNNMMWTFSEFKFWSVYDGLFGWPSTCCIIEKPFNVNNWNNYFGGYLSFWHRRPFMHRSFGKWNQIFRYVLTHQLECVVLCADKKFLNSFVSCMRMVCSVHAFIHSSRSFWSHYDTQLDWRQQSMTAMRIFTLRRFVW